MHPQRIWDDRYKLGYKLIVSWQMHELQRETLVELSLYLLGWVCSK